MAKLNFYLDTRSGSESFPLKLRITQHRKSVYIGLDIKLRMDQWADDTIVNHPKAKSLNDFLISKMAFAESTLLKYKLANNIDKAFITNSEVTFVIGGSKGFDDRVRKKSNLTLSFGRVTFPHQLVRLMLFEQIYRSFSIVEGSPYHK